MSNQKTRTRDLTKLAEAEGLIVDSVESGHHIKLYVRTVSGRKAVVTLARSPSDYRDTLNARSYFRRIARGVAT